MIDRKLPRGRRRRRLALGAALKIGALLTAGLATLPLAGPAAVIGALIGYGIGGGSAQVPLQHYLLGHVGDRAPVAISLLSGSLYLGSALGTGIGAVTLHAVGYHGLAYLAAIPAFLALAIAVTLTAGGIRDSRRAAGPDRTAGAKVPHLQPRR